VGGLSVNLSYRVLIHDELGVVKSKVQCVLVVVFMFVQVRASLRRSRTWGSRVSLLRFGSVRSGGAKSRVTCFAGLDWMKKARNVCLLL